MQDQTLLALHNKKSVSIRKIIDDCEYNLYAFAKLLNPYYIYGDVHQELFSFLSSPEATDRQLALLPRGHLKSHCMAVLCAWNITYRPWTSLVYISAQDDLAKAQLYTIKSMMTSDTYSAIWAEMFTEEKGERGTWSAFAFDVDHPCRKERGIRDHTMIIKTVKSNATGLHCDGLIFDDVVVQRFAETQIGRNELNRSLGYFSSVLNPGGWIKVAGTRYHPADSYQSMVDARRPIWDDKEKDFVGEELQWQLMERVVENSPDRSGTGVFLWPRTKSPFSDESYGFDIRELTKIKADYESHEGLVHFYSQYYNDPNDVGTQRIGRDKFQYFDRQFLTVARGTVRYRGNKLNVYCSMDVAWSDNPHSDYTAIVVIGVDQDGFFYVLDMDRFKTTKFQQYYDVAVAFQAQYGFRKMIIESNAGGHFVAQEVETLVRKNGGNLVIERAHRTQMSGTKQERWAAILEPKYETRSVFHCRGGLTATLEEELISSKPRHDDLKDAMCSAMSIAKIPATKKIDYTLYEKQTNVIIGKFGGRARVR